MVLDDVHEQNRLTNRIAVKKKSFLFIAFCKILYVVLKKRFKDIIEKGTVVKKKLPKEKYLGRNQ